MSKDILDKLELKNKENLSSNRFNDDPVRAMSRNLEYLKISDFTSNNDFVQDDFGVIEENSYIELENIVEDADKVVSENKDSNISGIPFRIDKIK